MTLTTREFWTALHGMVFGAGFLLAFTGSAVSLWMLRSEYTTPAGRIAAGRWLIFGSCTMAILAWLAVAVGTFAIYPWYRAAPPIGTAPSALVDYPKALLLSNPKTTDWHEFGMEWKEHVGWLIPFFATPVAFVAMRNRRSLAVQSHVRRGMMALLCAAFFCASVAGLFGALINKMAPVK